MEHSPKLQLDGLSEQPVESLGPWAPAVRVAVGLGDPDRESELLPALGRDGTFVVVERCVSADHLVERVMTDDVDVALVADGLHRLAGSALASLAHGRVPLVVLASPGDASRWHDVAAVVLPADAEAEAVRRALFGASRGEVAEARPGPEDVPVRVPLLVGDDIESTDLTTLGIASGHGSPGRTLVAVNLAAALGAVGPTVLVDADVDGPSVATYLDLDPTRNIYMLAHADPRSPRDWDRAIASETQPLGSRIPHGVALCGLPKPEMRGGVSPPFFERLLDELRRRYRFVVLDVGADLIGAEAVVHRLALGASGQILFVASADLVGLRHARVGLGTLARSLSVDDERIALVVNRYDRRYHHARSEIEWALGRPSAAIIPDDHPHVQQAMLAQRPLVLDRRSAAGRHLLDLAERVHGGAILLPPEPTDRGGMGLLRRVSGWRPRWPLHVRRHVNTGERYESDLVSTP